MDVSPIVGSFRKGLKLYKWYIKLSFVPNTACLSLANSLIKSVNYDDYNYVVSQIMIGPQKVCDENSGEDILELVGKIHGKLEDSPVDIMPFIKSCFWDAVFYQTKFKNS